MRIPASSRHILAAVAVLFLSMPAFSQAPAAEGSLRERLQERRLAKTAAAQPTSLSEATLSPGTHRIELQHGGIKRDYLLFIPASYRPGVPAPLLFAFHGGMGNMNHFADNYGVTLAAETHGSIVVIPNGTGPSGSGRMGTWNAGLCCHWARDNKIDDVGFVGTILSEVSSRLTVDRRRVYATGMSNGAMLAYRVACELSGSFTAIAAVAGTDNTGECRPTRPVSVLHIHARDDERVLFDGGAGPANRDPSKVTDFASVSSTVSRWVSADRCQAQPRRVLSRDGAQCDLYAPCSSGAAVQLCVTEAGGHSWPGATSRRKTTSTALDANQVMWDFLNALPSPR